VTLQATNLDGYGTPVFSFVNASQFTAFFTILSSGVIVQTQPIKYSTFFALTGSGSLTLGVRATGSQGQVSPGMFYLIVYCSFTYRYVYNHMYITFDVDNNNTRLFDSHSPIIAVIALVIFTVPNLYNPPIINATSAAVTVDETASGAVTLSFGTLLTHLDNNPACSQSR
jgi:hypothetical protein